MRDPREALRAARRAAKRASAGQAVAEAAAAEAAAADRAPGSRRLVQWAIIEPDQAQVYSTRRWGRPITWLKRALVRLLRQYLDQVTAQQSRFNAHVAAEVLRLEQRIGELERRLATREGARDRGTPEPR
jgi:hypothetical protein